MSATYADFRSAKDQTERNTYELFTSVNGLSRARTVRQRLERREICKTYSPLHALFNFIYAVFCGEKNYTPYVYRMDISDSDHAFLLRDNFFAQQQAYSCFT